MDNLIKEFNNLSVTDIKNKVEDTYDIDELNELVGKLSLSNKFNIEEKKAILYWVFCQTDTINKALYEKEKLHICSVH